MKKTILSILLAVMTVAFVSCDKASSFERQAKKQMEETLKELAKNPETFKITDVKTKFNNDSTCVLHVKTKGQNGFGGWSISNFEYIYVKSKNVQDNCYELYEAITNLEDDGKKGESVYQMAKRLYRDYKDYIGKDDYKDLPVMKLLNGKGWDSESKECRAYMIHSACEITAVVKGRQLNDDNKKKDDWK